VPCGRRVSFLIADYVIGEADVLRRRLVAGTVTATQS
jgi:hypothetical protein